MASLEIIPNLDVLVVQGCIFAANLVVVKKLLVEPYIAVRDRREKLTIGSKDEASSALADAEGVSKAIGQRLESASTDAKKARDALRETALQRRQALLTEAEGLAKKHIEAIEADIKAELQRERSKIPSTVASLTDEVYKVALS
jgi:F0F1-type ATP synthase membrane subunit b/b'